MFFKIFYLLFKLTFYTLVSLFVGIFYTIIEFKNKKITLILIGVSILYFLIRSYIINSIRTNGFDLFMFVLPFLLLCVNGLYEIRKKGYSIEFYKKLLLHKL